MKNIFLLLAFSLGLNLLSAQELKTSKDYPHWNYTFLEPMKVEDLPNKNVEKIQLKGTNFVNSKGEKIFFKGLAIADPDKIALDGHWNKQHFDAVKSTGTNLVRIPVHPAAWQNRGRDEYIKLLDDAIKWCNELDLYVILDWHSIGNASMDLYFHPMYNTSLSETYNFWVSMAIRYQNINTVAFCEVFNEPTVWEGRLGILTWPQWKEINENLIDLIHKYDSTKLVIVAGLDWAYDLSPVADNPVNRLNVVYAVHPYAHKRPQPWSEAWERDFGKLSKTYPVFATEFGFTINDGNMPDNVEYGEEIISFCENHNISWAAWVFDPDWFPQMLIKDYTYEPSQQGAFFIKAFKGKL